MLGIDKPGRGAADVSRALIIFTMHFVFTMYFVPGILAFESTVTVTS